MGRWEVRALSLIGVAVAAAIASCGGRVDEAPEVTPGFWSEAQAPVLLAPPAAIEVPGGRVRLGYWRYVEATDSLVPSACDDGSGLRSVQQRVAPFRLMRTEVTNAMYDACVRAGVCEPPTADLSLDPEPLGEWNDPRRSSKPVAATYPQARRFCRAHGGDLPTYPQWVRALEGDGGSFGIGALTRAAMTCLKNGGGPLCAELDQAPWRMRESARRRLANPYRTMPPVEAFVWDRGPYGHAGMFAGAAEWVRDLVLDFSCSSDGANADAPFVGRVDPEAGANLNSVQSAMDLWWWPPTVVTDEHLHGQISGIVDSTFDTRPRMGGPAWYWNGFRCAFPP